MFVIAVCSALAVVVNVYGKCFGSRSKSTRPSEKHAKEHASSSEVSVARRSLPQLQPDVDTELSNRSIALDPAGYFVIRTEKTGARESYIIATYYTNTINKDGAPCTPFRNASLRVSKIQHCRGAALFVQDSHVIPILEK